MLSAGAKNITCIEPYPSNFLKTNTNIKLIKKQALTINKFEKDNIYENLSKNKKNTIS